jgi:Na+/serine symporter
MVAIVGTPVPAAGFGVAGSGVWIVQVKCSLHGSDSLVDTTSDEAVAMGQRWAAIHDNCSTRANYPRKRRA